MPDHWCRGCCHDNLSHEDRFVRGSILLLRFIATIMSALRGLKSLYVTSIFVIRHSTFDIRHSML
jgi:hypothetical protein